MKVTNHINELPKIYQEKYGREYGFVSHISMKLPKREYGDKKRVHNILFILDNSGSMSGGPLESVKKSVTYLCENLSSKDRVGILVFSTAARTILPMDYHPIETIREKVGDIHAEGLTNLESGIRLGADLLRNVPSDTNYVYILSDGCINGGISDLSGLRDIVDQLPGNNIVNSLGYSTAHDSQILDGIISDSGFYVHLNNQEDIYHVGGDILSKLNENCYPKITIKCNTDSQFMNGTREQCFTGGLPGNEIETILISKNQTPDIQISGLPETEINIIQKIDKEKVQFKTNYQLFRWRVIEYLHRLQAGIDKENRESLLAIIDDINTLIQEIKEFSDESTLAEEKIIDVLQRDLSAFVGKLYHGRLSVTDANLLRQIIREHTTQKTFSSFSQMRSTYVTQGQTMTRLKFLHHSMGNDMIDKKTVPLEFGNFDLERRSLAEKELRCHINLTGWREEYLGLGIYSHPKTKREIVRRLQPDMEISNFYLSQDAYNMGTRYKIQAAGGEDLKTTNGIISYWLPLYINAENWSGAKLWLPSAISLINTGFNDMFREGDIFPVMTNLLIRTVVKFTVGGRISKNAIRTFCYLDRLFLQLADEYPNLRQNGETLLENFIQDVSFRTRKRTPSLGDLIQYLMITDRFTWQDLQIPYLTEAYRRCTARLEEKFNIYQFQTEEELLEAWNQVNSANQVTMFILSFMRVMRTGTIQETNESYDAGWGYVDNATVDRIYENYNEVMSSKTLIDKIRYMGIDLKQKDIVNMVLWANTFGFNGTECVWKNNPKLNQMWERGRRRYMLNQKNRLMESEDIPPVIVTRKSSAGNKRKKYDYYPPSQNNPEKTLFFYVFHNTGFPIESLKEIETELLDYLGNDGIDSYYLAKNKKGISKHYGYLNFKTEESCTQFLNNSTASGNHVCLYDKVMDNNKITGNTVSENTKNEDKKCWLHVQICKRDLDPEWVPDRLTGRREYLKMDQGLIGEKAEEYNSYRRRFTHLQTCNFSSIDGLSQDRLNWNMGILNLSGIGCTNGTWVHDAHNKYPHIPKFAHSFFGDLKLPAIDSFHMQFLHIPTKFCKEDDGIDTVYLACVSGKFLIEVQYQNSMPAVLLLPTNGLVVMQRPFLDKYKYRVVPLGLETLGNNILTIKTKYVENKSE